MSYVVFPHIVFERLLVKLFHTVLNEVKHGSAGSEAESLNETFAGLEPS